MPENTNSKQHPSKKARKLPPHPGLSFKDVPSMYPEPDYPFPALSLEQRMHFELYGYTILDDLFTPQEMAAIESVSKKEKQGILDATGDACFPKPPPETKYHAHRNGSKWRGVRNEMENGDFYLDRLEIEGTLGLDPIFLSILTKPRLFGIATELLGGTFRFDMLAVRFNQRSTNNVLGWHGGVSRHRDRAVCMNGWFHTQILGLILFLTDVGPEDGGTGIFAGSHKFDIPFDELRTYIENNPQSPFFHQVEAKRGSVLLFADGPLMHRTIPIRSDRERLIMLCRMVHSDYLIGDTDWLGCIDSVPNELIEFFHGRAFKPRYRPRETSPSIYPS